MADGEVKRKCRSTTKAGKPCRAWARTSGYCQAHDPELASERAAWRKSGGKARAVGEGEPVDLLTVGDVRSGLAAVIGSTWKLQNSPERNRVLISGYREALRTYEIGELEGRLEAIEQRIEILTGVGVG